MIPDELKSNLPFTLLKPDIMAKPIVYLASAKASKVTGERIVATEFDEWLQARQPKKIVFTGVGLSCGIEGC